MDWNDKRDGLWAMKKSAKRQKLNNSNPKPTSRLIYRTSKGDFEIARGALDFNIPVKPVKGVQPDSRPEFENLPSSRTAKPKTVQKSNPSKSRKRVFDLIDFSAEEVSSEEESSEVEIPESLESDECSRSAPSLASIECPSD